MQCVENMSHSNCPVCLEDLHTSKEPCQIPRCQHLVHKSCFDQLIKSCHFYCPSCAQSLIDLTPLWMAMQQQIDENPMTGKFQVCKFHLHLSELLQC
jgi:RING finger/CHY zinc finger protein 1